MPKPTLKGLAQRSTRGWGAVIAGGIVLTLMALADGPGFGNAAGTATTATTTAGTASSAAATADGSTGCQMQVTSPELKLRSGPSVNAGEVTTLTQGAIVDGLPEVTDGFRHLKDNRWAANEFLVAVAGTHC